MKNQILVQNKEDFCLIHKKQASNVNKQRFTELSSYFRESNEILQTNFADLNDNISKESVTAFIKFINTDNLEITKENAIELLDLFIDWKIEKSSNKIADFINDNFTLEDIIAKADKYEFNTCFNAFSSVISSRLDAAIKIPKFSELSLEKITAIVPSKSIIYSDHDQFFNFIMIMLDKYHDEAYPLISVIDISRLTPNQAEKLFSRPEFAVPNETAQSDIQRINDKIQTVSQSMESLQGNKNSLNILTDRFRVVEKNLQDITDVIDANEEKSFEKIDELKQRANNLQRKVKNDSRRMRSDFKSIVTKIKSYETKYSNDFAEEE